jgi:dihydrofolate reductase
VFSRKGVISPTSEALTTTALKDARKLGGSTPVAPAAASAASWAAATVAGRDLAEDIARMKRQPGRDLLVHGGARFAQSLAGAGLIEEYRPLTHPVALGRGLPLFSSLARPMDLRLVSATPFPSGAAAHVYRPL